MTYLVLVAVLGAAGEVAPTPPASPAPVETAAPVRVAAPAPAAPAKPGKRRSLAALRQQCYGGRGKELMAGVRSEFLRQADEAVLERNFARGVHWYRRALRAGGEDAGTLRRIGIALLATGKPEDAKAADACGDLLDRRFPPLPQPPSK